MSCDFKDEIIDDLSSLKSGVLSEHIKKNFK